MFATAVDKVVVVVIIFSLGKTKNVYTIFEDTCALLMLSLYP